MTRQLDLRYPLDPAVVALAGVNLVEASAGTGKTHAVTDLYLRLVVEAGHGVDRILVVTYTKAATAELRERVRARLGIAVRMAAQAATGTAGSAPDADADPFVAGLLKRCPDAALVRRRLELACQTFDEAAIHTVHGFCQRILDDHAFEGGRPFEVELIGDDLDFLRGIVRDFWRRALLADPDLAAPGPDALAQWVRPYAGKPYLRIDPEPVPTSAPGRLTDPPRALELARARLERAIEAAAVVWASAGEEAYRLLAESSALNRNMYGAKRLETLRAHLDAVLGIPRSSGEGLDAKLLGLATPGGLARGARKGTVAPAHELFDACGELTAAHDELARLRADRDTRMRAECLAYTGTELRRRARERRVQTFDELLIATERALVGPGGARFAAAVRERYPCALIDEFQDTDPVQLAIFRSLYADTGSPVFLVGDPKQAIYGFRGADVFAYVEGRTAAEHTHTLATNRRSVPGLVGVVNHLFAAVTEPFVLPEIDFARAEPGRSSVEALVVEGDRPEPMRIWRLPGGEDGKAATRGAADEAACVGLATEVARLLALGRQGRARIGERALGGRDIAVLVRTNRQGRLAQSALAEAGVRSVRPAQDSVFATPEACWVEQLLLAVASPRREALVRAALASPLGGLDAGRLLELARDDSGWDGWVSRFHRWRDLWERDGFSRMYRDALAALGVAERWLAAPRGDRAYTNVLQIGELAEQAALERHAGVDELLGWLSARRRVTFVESEEYVQRLESDENLVRIVTVHGAKGLQYPIVLYPFAWDGGWKRTDPTPLYHDPARGNAAVLDLGGDPAPRVLAAVAREDASERLRLLYVALTRAEHRCYLAYGSVSGAERSALAHLLAHAKGEEVGALERLASALPAAVRIEPPPSPGPRLAAERRAAPARLRARRFRGGTAPRWRVTSFTGLTSGLPPELPDHDAATPVDGAAPNSGHEPGAGEFPRGARAGSCMHALLERLDYQRPLAGQEPIVLAALVEHGFDRAFAPAAARLAEQALRTPLAGGAGVALASVPRARRRAELEFYLAADELAPEPLAGLLTSHGYPTSLDGDDPGLGGFLKGYVDLVFEADGRYYVVDFKTHWLGPEPADYAPERLREVMREERYHLQSLLYQLAVHRYLRVRLPGYAPERHLGGAYYLFVRGMDPARAGAGIHFDPSPLALIEALDRAIGGSISGRESFA